VNDGLTPTWDDSYGHGRFDWAHRLCPSRDGGAHYAPVTDGRTVARCQHCQGEVIHKVNLDTLFTREVDSILAPIEYAEMSERHRLAALEAVRRVRPVSSAHHWWAAKRLARLADAELNDPRVGLLDEGDQPQ